MPDSGSLPPSIQELLWNPPATSNNLEVLSSLWAEHARQVAADAPFAVIQDGGETIYTGGLSPGCQACKAGEWDCLFLTPRCNLACAFCCSPSLGLDSVPLSAFGREVDVVIDRLRAARPAGISFSGGEVFLDFPRLRGLVERFRTEFPDVYLWTYTNGLLAGIDQLDELGKLGLDEVRFNLAASGYTHPGVLAKVEQASRSLPAVTVEIPAIPGDEAKLLAALETWSRAGARFLNLHELMFEPGSLSENLSGRGCASAERVEVRTPDGHATAIHQGSRPLVLKVMQAVHAAGLPLAVNDCSMQNKLRQVRGRRALLARAIEGLPGSYEKIGADGYLHSLCAYDADGETVFLHPDRLEQVREEYPGFHIIELRRMPPLSMDEQPRWEYAHLIPL